MTPSQLQSETARINGAQSTGPVTAEGKAISSQNALKHGLTAKQAVLPNEDQAEYDRHLADYIKSFRPSNQAEHDLVKTLVDSRWRLNRLMRLEAALLQSADEPKQLLKALSLLMRYENQLNRSYDKAFTYLQVLKGNQPPPKLSASRNEPGERAAGCSAVRDSNVEMSDFDAAMTLEVERLMRAPLPGQKIRTDSLTAGIDPPPKGR